MLKDMSQLAERDWVLLAPRAHGGQARTLPLQVVALSPLYAYLERPGAVLGGEDFGVNSGLRKVPRRAIAWVFSDKATAQAAFEFAQANDAACEQAQAELRAAYARKFDDFIATLPAEPVDCAAGQPQPADAG